MMVVSDNADLNVKASETCQEIIDPDNGDGFALMWGGARSTYGIRIPRDMVDFPTVIFQIKVRYIFWPFISSPCLLFYS